jgi:hypothetical protein
MTLDWQTLIVLACVACAAAVVLRRAWRLLRANAAGRDASCSGCHGGCGSDVVPLDLPLPVATPRDAPADSA